jgi:transposase
LVLIERQLARLDDRLRATLDEPRFVDEANRLMSFPGVGRVIAATILAEVGDFARFERRDALTRYAGLNPRLFRNAETHRTGRIAKDGSSDLRWGLVQAPWTVVGCDDSVKASWLRMGQGIGSKRVIVAMARGMLGWMWAAQRRGVHYGVRVAA